MLTKPTQNDYKYACGTKASTLNKTGEWRFMAAPERVKKLSPCCQDCLLDSDIPEWLEAVKEGRWEEAWQIISRYNPFPALTGHVCYSPCIENCNRGRLDQEIDIQSVERAIGQWRLDHYQPPSAPREVKDKVAVVGSGPAGLSCAYYLSTNGYRVTVFESAPLIGGMLALGIPEYRLPGQVLQKELQVLEEEGINFVTEKTLGKNLKISDLNKDYSRVFLATGAWLSRKEDIPGMDKKGVCHALDFLSMTNTGRQPEMNDPIVVIGGGNAAIDSARSALRMNGVNHVSLIYRRSRAEMPANPGEVEAAEREGVELIFNALPREIETDADQASAVLLDYSKTDREGLVVDKSRSFRKSCGTVIMALGQEVDYSIFEKLDQEIELFAGGDLVSGPATVAEAIRAGRLAAFSIMSRLEGSTEPDLNPSAEKPVSFEELNLDARASLKLQHRQGDPAEESGRCLGCGTCNSCGICYLFCPDMAVDWVNNRYELNLDYCKGCGICVKECPARVLFMEGG